MNPRYLLSCFLALLLGFAPLKAQQQSAPCGADEVRKQLLAENPDLDKIQKLAEDQYLEHLLHGATAENNTTLTIPVVVHILHLPGTPVGTGENLTNAQVIAGLDALNSLLMGNPCSGNAPGNPVGIQLCLATQNINGEATTGIDRYATNLSNIPYGQTSVVHNVPGITTHFPPSSYLNIFLAKSIWSFNSGSGIVDSLQGMATGSMVHGRFTDGMYVRSKFWYDPSNVCEGAKVSAHQLGHYLDLFHTFEAGCPNDNCHLQGDRVCDTPPDNLRKTGSICGVNNSCSTDDDDDIHYNPFITDQPDPENNFMDYSAQVCQTQFTLGQVDRMNLALTVARRSLLSSIGCNAPCAPYVNAQIEVPEWITTNTAVTFKSTQTVGSPTLKWLLNGQQIGTSSTLNYTFANPGAYTLELVLTNATGCTRTIGQKVQVYKNCDLDISIPAFVPICYGSDLELLGYPGGGQWTLDDEPNSGYISSQDYTPGSTHTLRYTVTDGDCLETTTRQITISSVVLTVTSFGAIDCMNPQPIQVMVQIGGGGGFYSWTDPLGNDGVGNGPMFTTSVGGTYEFSAFKNGASCEGYYYIQTMNNQLDVTAQNCTVCTNSFFPKATLCATSPTPNLIYSWSNGSYPSIGQQVQVITKGQWRVIATNNAGCEAVDMVEIKSMANFNPGVAAGTDISWYCFQQMPRLNGAFTPGGDVTAYWSTTEGHILPDTNAMNPRVSRPGMYVLIVKNNVSNCVATDTAYVVELNRKAEEVKTICAGQSYQGHSTTGVYLRTVTYARSCDSIYTLKLTVLPPNLTETFQTICTGESFQGYTNSGIYSNTYVDQYGCDSTHTLHLTVQQPVATTSAQVICAGETYQGYNTSGIYTNTYANQNGCDSTHTLALTVLPAIATTSSQTICAGETYQGYSASGAYSNTYTAQNGCDSVHTLALTVLPAIATTSSQTICAGETYQGYSASGAYSNTYTAQNGCDSVHTLALTVLPAITATSSQSICAGETYQGYSVSGTYTNTYTAQGGCDSTHILVLNVLSSISTTSSQSICAGETYQGYSASGTYTNTYTAQNGCDSTHVLVLNVSEAIGLQYVITSDNGMGSGSIQATAIGSGPFTYQWNNGSTSTGLSGIPAGMYALTVTDQNNCTASYTFEVLTISAANEAAWKSAVRLYPNPISVGQQVFIEMPETNPVHLYRVFDAQGRLMQTDQVNQSKLALRLEQAGAYWIQLVDAQGLSAIWCVVVVL